MPPNDARDHLLQKRDAVFAEISAKLGTNVGMAEIGRNKWLAEAFDKHKSNIHAPKRATLRSPPATPAGCRGIHIGCRS